MCTHLHQLYTRQQLLPSLLALYLVVVIGVIYGVFTQVTTVVSLTLFGN